MVAMGSAFFFCVNTVLFNKYRGSEPFYLFFLINKHYHEDYDFEIEVTKKKINIASTPNVYIPSVSK